MEWSVSRSTGAQLGRCIQISVAPMALDVRMTTPATVDNAASRNLAPCRAIKRRRCKIWIARLIALECITPGFGKPTQRLLTRPTNR